MSEWEIQNLREYRTIRAFVEGLWQNEHGKWLGYLLDTFGRKLASVIDKRNRKSAMFCYGIEEFELDRWVPVDYASYDLERVKAVKMMLEKKTGSNGFRIVRFEKNIEVEE